MNLTRHIFVLLAVVFLGAAPARCIAQTGTNAPMRPQPGRWLLIVDTSSAMQKRSDATLGVIADLVSSGMNGQMNRGEEFGIWTFNKQVYPGVAPMQVWDAARSNIIAGRTVGFLSKQPFKSKSKPELVIAELDSLVKESRQLTVVMFSDGAADLAGTPFDAAVNAAYAEHRPELKQNRMPLITVLRVHKGKYLAQKVSVAPWPVQFPPFPEPPKTNAPAVTTITTTNAPKPEARGTIIIRPEPKKPATNEQAAAMQTGGVVLRQYLEPDNDASNAVKVVVVEPLPMPTNVTPATVVAPVQPTPVATVIESNPAPATVVHSAPEPVKPAAVPAPAIQPATSATPAAVIAPAPVPAPTKETATTPNTAAPAADTVSVRKWPLILGITLMWVAIAVSLMLARRARRANASSLITKSFDKK